MIKRNNNIVFIVLVTLIGLAIGLTAFLIGESFIVGALVTILFVVGIFLNRHRDGILNFLSSILVIIVGLLIGFTILLVSNAEQAVPAFMTILTFGASSMRNVGDVLLFATPIIFTGLSVAFAYRTGLFNIGATGQYTFGAFVAIFIGIAAGRTGPIEEIVWNIPGTIYVWTGYSAGVGEGTFLFLAPGLRIIACIVAAAMAGAVWGAIPGFLKAYRNVHEVITSIMTNYIAMLLVSHLINQHIFDSGRGTTLPLAEGSNLPSMGFEYIFADHVRASNVNLGIVLAIVAAILVYIILEKTTFGYELKACGFNRDAAKYVGINEKKNIVSSMMICGALAGMGGALKFMNDIGLSLTATQVLQQEGFTGISVAFLGLNHPIAIIFSGAFVSYISLGGTRIQPYGFSVEIIEIVIAIIIYFCAFVFLVKHFLGRSAVSAKKERGDGQGTNPAIKIETEAETKQSLDDHVGDLLKAVDDSLKDDSEFEPEPARELTPDLTEEPAEGRE
jgi:simple sugar transport system permease protein